MIALMKQPYTPPILARRELPYTLLHGDCIAEMKKLADNSVDSIVCDPPYALTSGRLRVGYEYCLRYILLNVMFPNLNNTDIKQCKALNFAGVTSKTPDLHSVDRSGIEAGIGVPVSTVDLQCNAVIQHEVNNISELSRDITESELSSVGSTQDIQLSGDLILQLRDAVGSLSFCKGACSCYRSLGSGIVAFNVVITGATFRNCFTGSDLPSFISTLTNDVGLRDNALRDTCASASIMTGATTELTAMLTLDTRNGTFKLSPTSGTNEAHLTLSSLSSQFVGTSAGASEITPPFQSTKSSNVHGITNGASPINRLFLHTNITSFLLYYTPNKGFMSKEWDNETIAFSVDTWREAMRVLRPGGHLLAFGGTRTYHRLASAIEDAGFQCRDMLAWLHGQGFPKSHNLGDGKGSALKPALEPIILARKPLSEKNLAANVLKYGTGGINIDKSRIGNDKMGGYDVAPGGMLQPSTQREQGYRPHWDREDKSFHAKEATGRFPSNLILSHSLFCQHIGTRKVRSHNPGNEPGSEKKEHPVYGKFANHGNSIGYADSEGMEQVEAYLCDDSCPIALLDSQSGNRKSGNVTKQAHSSTAWFGGGRLTNENSYGDEGGASRYFLNLAPSLDDMPPFYYASKSSKRDRSSDGVVNNTHPTCKSQQLMKYLCGLITPENGVILDPFMGSGSTGCAAISLGYRFVGIEQSEEYLAIASARLAHAALNAPVSLQGNAEEEWECDESCPILQLDKQSGIRKSGGGDKNNVNGRGIFGNGKVGKFSPEYEANEGGASRYFKQFHPGELFYVDEPIEEAQP